MKNGKKIMNAYIERAKKLEKEIKENEEKL